MMFERISQEKRERKALSSHAAWGKRPLQLDFFDPPNGQSGFVCHFMDLNQNTLQMRMCRKMP
jgi:hypothetical protein